MNSKYHNYLQPEIKEWLINNYTSYNSRTEIINKIYQEFGIEISSQRLANVIHYIRKKHSIPYIYENSLNSGRFKKGNEIGKETRFKKRDSDEVKQTNGYYVRINGKWERRSRLLYEKVNGEIPKGMKVVHINGDKFDDRIENLALVGSKEQNLICGNQWFFDDKKYFDTACTLVKLKRKVVERHVSY